MSAYFKKPHGHLFSDFGEARTLNSSCRDGVSGPSESLHVCLSRNTDSDHQEEFVDTTLGPLT